jgi:hypothetical protein
MVFLRSPEYVGQCALAMNCDLQLKTQSRRNPELCFHNIPAIFSCLREFAALL